MSAVIFKNSVQPGCLKQRVTLIHKLPGQRGLELSSLCSFNASKQMGIKQKADFGKEEAIN